MTELDRRAFLARTGRLVAAASLASAWALAGDAPAAVDPRLRSLARDVRGPGDHAGRRRPTRARGSSTTSATTRVQPLGIVQPRLGRGRARGRALGAADRVRLAVRSGGHSYAGYSTTTGLVVDLRRLHGIAFHAGRPPRRSARARGSIDVEAALAARGRAIPAGSCADGRDRRARARRRRRARLARVRDDERQRPLARDRHRRRPPPHLQQVPSTRTSSGPAAAAAAATSGSSRTSCFRTHPVSPVSYFFAAGRGRRPAEVVRAWQAFAPHAPDGLFSICALADRLGTARACACFGQFLGGEATLRTLLAPLDARRRRCGSPPARRRTSTRSSAGPAASARPSASATSPARRRTGRSPARASRPKSDYVNAPLSRAAIATAPALDRARAERGLRLGERCCSTPTAARSTASRRTRPRSCTATRSARASTSPTGTGRRRGRRARLAPRLPRRDAAARLGLRVPELHRPRPHRLAARLLRRELRAAARVKKAVDPDWFFRFPQAIEPA